MNTGFHLNEAEFQQLVSAYRALSAATGEREAATVVREAAVTMIGNSMDRHVDHVLAQVRESAR